jgi:hypothetical protein
MLRYSSVELQTQITNEMPRPITLYFTEWCNAYDLYVVECCTLTKKETMDMETAEIIVLRAVAD